MTTSPISKPAQIALTTGRVTTSLVKGASGVSCVGLLVVSILMLTNVVPGGLPVGITTGVVGGLVIGSNGLNVFFGGTKNKKTGKVPLSRSLPIRVTTLAVGLLAGATLITLGGLHVFTVLQGTQLLNVHQLAWGIIGTYCATIPLAIIIAIPIAIKVLLSPEQKSLRARAHAASLQRMGVQPTAAPYTADDHMRGVVDLSSFV